MNRDVIKFFILLAFAIFAALTLLSATGGVPVTSYAQPDIYAGRPPQFTPAPTAAGSVVAATPVPTAVASKYPPGAPASFPTVSPFGMNMYLTGQERSNLEASTLGQSAVAGGVKWSREELSWANVEVRSKGDTAGWSYYDGRLALDAQNGLSVIGMLLTTPKWASTNPNASDYYWYEPANFNDYFDYVRAAVTRWKGQVHVWEIWNEPNAVGTWNCINSCDRAADYARLLQGAYAAVKSVDPTARVLIGGLYVHDTDNEGLAFLDQVVADSGGAINFDGLSIHTYMPDRIPESLQPGGKIQNFQYRLNMVNDWIDAHGGQPSEIWITEDGRSTLCSGCPPSMVWSHDDQASMLARMYGIALATRRVAQFDYFQLEDKFNNPADLFGGMAITTYNSITHAVATTSAYNSYKTIQGLLDGATFVGAGPQLVSGNVPQQPANSDYIGFDYKFKNGSKNIEMVWRTDTNVAVDLPVSASVVQLIDRDGGVTNLTASNGTVHITIGPRPQYVVTAGCTSRFTDICPDYWAYPYIDCLASHNIISGYPDGSFGPNNSITRGQLAKVVANAAGYSENHVEQSFADIAPGSTYYIYIQRLASRSILGGYACGGVGEPCNTSRLPYFRPNADTSRGQIAKIIAAAAGYSDPPGSPRFQDVTPGSTFYTWVQQLASRNVMSGYACGGTGEPCLAGSLPYFRPALNATRAQVAKIVANAFFPSCTAANP